jgi:hypothetical protein
MGNNAVCLACLRNNMLSLKSYDVGVTVAAVIRTLHLLFILFIFSVSKELLSVT